jgi:hypothetical protein
MENWYAVTMQDTDISAHKDVQLQNDFINLFIADGGPRDAAMFGDLAGTGHHFYFSPGAMKFASSFLATYAAVPCQRPPGNQVMFLVGEENAAWRLVRKQL